MVTQAWLFWGPSWKQCSNKAGVGEVSINAAEQLPQLHRAENPVRKVTLELFK